MFRAHKVLPAAALLACQERLVDNDARQVCSYVTAAKVYDEQGNPVAMVMHEGGGNTPVCLCLTPDDVKSGDYDEWFDEQVQQACLEDAAKMGYPDAHDCDYWHDIGQWITNIRAVPDLADVPCDPEESEP